MDPSTFIAPAAGRLVTTDGGAAAFVPSPLPPELESSWPLVNAVSRAAGSLGYLNGFAHALPSIHLLVALFLHREAMTASRLDGTQGRADAATYAAALDYGLTRVREAPVSLELIRELHARLSEGGTIEAAVVDTPHAAALDNFEKFLHAESHLPALIRLALVHYQFEAIHPFLDGNGRVGRLLITLLLHTERLLDQPLLYLSAFFEQRRDEYYEHLLAVSQRGAWSEWVELFLPAVHAQH